MKLRKELLGALIGLAKTTGNNPKTENTDRVIIEGLVAVRTESFGEEMLKKKLEMVRQEKNIIAPNCSTCASPCGNTSEYDLNLLNEDECRSLKEQMLQNIQEAAVVYYQAMMLRMDVLQHMEIFYKALSVVCYRMETRALEEIIREIQNEKLLISDLKR